MKADPGETAKIGTFSRARDSIFTIVISSLALTLAAISLFETVLRQPRFSVYTASRWEYGRGRQNAAEEIIVVPLTISNRGAREGAVLDLQLTITDGAGRSRTFWSSYMISPATAIAVEGANMPSIIETFGLFAPMAVSARASQTASVVFAAGPRGDPLIAAAGTFRAEIGAHTSYDDIYGRFDAALYAPPAPLNRCAYLEFFDIALAVKGQNATMRTTEETDCFKN